jgi:hypothetical protein
MQTNIAENIQVNNAQSPVDQANIAQSKLLGSEDGKLLDGAPEIETSGRNTALEAVETLNGAKVTGG